ncbi:hypothetical protein [Staphylococcus sp. 11261D007BR]
MKYTYLYLLMPLLPIEFIAAYVDYTTGSLLGYLPYCIVSLFISLYIFKNQLKRSKWILINRIMGFIISLAIASFVMHTYDSSYYFKPFTTNEFMIFLGIINFVIIAVIYLIIYVFSSKNR